MSVVVLVLASTTAMYAATQGVTTSRDVALFLYLAAMTLAVWELESRVIELWKEEE